ncbi:MAG: 1-acyl-sn-glycerol-3-phosphate acyltransferase [Firmicutes bacterium]|nr:1-acyl-sn-glycerol-3-phosphate acyltransferase [Bacillota bacterium]
MVPNKNNKKETWIKKRHKFIVPVGMKFIGMYAKWKYNIDAKPYKDQGKRQYLIMINHQTSFDQFFVGMVFKGPIYFVASEDIFSIGWVSHIIKWLINPVPIKKSVNDMRAVRNCAKIAKEGGTIALAPEGNRTYSGRQCYMKPGIVAFVKLLKLPVAFLRIEGGYGVQPRWSDVKRKGKMTAYVSRVLEPEEWGQMNDEEIFQVIKTELDVDEAKNDKLYYHEKSAEYLDRAMYVCPDCGLSDFYSEGQFMTCKKCGLKIRYTETTELEGVDKPFPFRYVADWYDYQENFIRRLDMETFEDKPIYTDRVKFSEVILYQNKNVLSEDAVFTMYKDRYEVELSPGTIMALAFDKISAVSTLGKNKLNIYYEDKIYQVKPDKHFNALKYMNIYYHATNTEKGEETNVEFLGL